MALEESAMTDVLWLLGVVAAYLVATRWILPRFGIKT
jgi:hypothetical protein